MCDKEFEIAESPKHTDARHSAVLGGHDIYITVADIDSAFPISIHLTQSFKKWQGFDIANCSADFSDDDI